MNRLPRQVVDAICQALRSSELFRRHSGAIGARSSRVLVANEAQTGWQLVPAGTQVLPIAPPVEGDRGRSWRVSPALREDGVVSPAAAPNLRALTVTHDAWPDYVLAEVVRSISPATLARRAEADHVVQFLAAASPHSPLATATAEALEDLLRRALLDETVGVSG